MSSEARNPRTMDIDEQPAVDAVRAILREDAFAISVALEHADQIAAAVDLVAGCLDRGGTLHYFGAGASGRIAFLDATELGPTFGAPAGMVTAHFPGGFEALIDPATDLEDSRGLGVTGAESLGEADVAFGITASGATPYVAGALEQARERGARTILLTCTSEPRIDADLVIAIPTGPEAITGSTRLKAGTATKCALNAFSTALMVQMGRTYSNLMSGVTVTNEKLQGRAVRIVSEVTGSTADEARFVLNRTGWRTDRAIVHVMTGCELSVAERALAEHRTIRRAITALASN